MIILSYFAMAITALASVRVAPWPLALAVVISELGYQALCFWIERKYATKETEEEADARTGQYL